MDNTDQTVAGEAENEARGDGKKTPSPARKGEANGKIGPNGYNRSVENIRHDLDRFEKEHHKLREDIRKTLSLVEQILPKSAPGDLSAFVDRGLTDPVSPSPALPDRNVIARTWEEGKRTVEELDAFYSRLRTQKIWSQEDLEGILTRIESVAQRIADSVHVQQNATELESSPTDKAPHHRTLEEIKNLSCGISELEEKITESRRAILDAIADRVSVPGANREISFDPNVLSPLLQKIGDLEGMIREHRPSASLDPASAVGSAGLPARGIRASLFAKTVSEVPKSAEKSVMSPRIKRLGFIWIMVSLAIVAIVARVRHSGPPHEPTKPIVNREWPRPFPPLPKVETRLPQSVPTFQSPAPILAGLDKLREGENANGQALADLSGKIDKVLASLPKGAALTAKEKRLIGEGRELEWLVKTWPAGASRKELLRMMGNYAGE